MWLNNIDVIHVGFTFTSVSIYFIVLVVGFTGDVEGKTCIITYNI